MLLRAALGAGIDAGEIRDSNSIAGLDHLVSDIDISGAHSCNQAAVDINILRQDMECFSFNQLAHFLRGGRACG